MTTYHVNLSRRWNSLDRPRQILNIASELHRAQHWLGRNDENLRLSLERALELIDYSIDDRQRWRHNRLRELLRLREALAASYLVPPGQDDMAHLIHALLLLDPVAAAQLPARAKQR